MPTSAHNEIAECRPESIGVDAIRSRVLMVRGVQVMLAPDLAMLYNVPTKRLNEQVKRNIERSGTRYLPYVFTEHGVIILLRVKISLRAVRHWSIQMTMWWRLGVLKSRHLGLFPLVHNSVVGTKSEIHRFRALIFAAEHFFGIICIVSGQSPLKRLSYEICRTKRTVGSANVTMEEGHALAGDMSRTAQNRQEPSDRRIRRDEWMSLS